MKGKLSFYSFFLQLSIRNLLCLIAFTLSFKMKSKLIESQHASLFSSLSETEEHFTVETAISNMTAVPAKGNTHHDKQLPSTSSSTSELRKQPPPQLTTVCKKATKTKKTKKQKLQAKKIKPSEVQEQSYDD